MILTDNILLIEPIGFVYNPETAADNRFQIEKKTNNVQSQFNNFKSTLVNAGVRVHVLRPPDEHPMHYIRTIGSPHFHRIV